MKTKYEEAVAIRSWELIYKSGYMYWRSCKSQLYHNLFIVDLTRLG